MAAKTLLYMRLTVNSKGRSGAHSYPLPGSNARCMRRNSSLVSQMRSYNLNILLPRSLWRTFDRSLSSSLKSSGRGRHKNSGTLHMLLLISTIDFASSAPNSVVSNFIKISAPIKQVYCGSATSSIQKALPF